MSAVTLNAAAAALATTTTTTRRSAKTTTTVASRGARRVVASFASANDNSGFAVSTRGDVRRRVTTRQASSKCERAMKRRGENIVTDAAAARCVCVVASRRFGGGFSTDFRRIPTPAGFFLLQGRWLE